MAAVVRYKKELSVDVDQIVENGATCAGIEIGDEECAVGRSIASPQLLTRRPVIPSEIKCASHVNHRTHAGAIGINDLYKHSPFGSAIAFVQFPTRGSGTRAKKEGVADFRDNGWV